MLKYKGFMAGLVILLLVTTSVAWAAVDISDIPLDAVTKAAPANIMFVLDDSGSMDWEIMTGEGNGLFSNQYYVFDNPGDNLYTDTRILTPEQRRMWRSQWSGYNTMYYNPDQTYEPWPTLPNADPDTPRSHPNVAGTTFRLSHTYLQFFNSTSTGIDIIVDNQDAGFSMVSGTWGESGAFPEWDGSSLFSGSAGARARWSFLIPDAGDYQVLAWWSSQPNWTRDSAANYIVNHNAGNTPYTVNQMNDFGQWNILGVHQFNAGNYSIEVQRGNSNTSADAVRLLRGTVMLNIPNAHYYVYSASESRPYLVIVDGGAISYYAVTSTSGAGGTEVVEALQLVANPPADVLSQRSYVEERQNFANWYSFYRRRELTATAAVSQVITQMSGVQIGIATINGNLLQPVLRIKVDGTDQTSSLLSSLYGLVLTAQGTPLRQGLQRAGIYYTDDANTGGIGTCPYWSAALGGECQQSFAILMTDGDWNGPNPNPLVGNADGAAGVPFADTYYNTLADVAYFYWGNDLSTNLNNLVPTSDINPANWQNMVTYGVTFGVTGTLDPNNYDLTASPLPTIPWPNPTAGALQRIDDVYHASVNGRGQFLSAGSPTELTDSLLAIMLDIKARIGSASSVSVNGDQLFKRIDNNTFMFQSSYNTNGWVGDIRSFKVDPNTGAIDLLSPEWSAANIWSSYNWSTYWDNRVIATHNGTTGVPFRITSLAAGQLSHLGSDLAEQTMVLEYLRGRNNNEISNGGTLRSRSSRLGDIVHSSPVYHNGLLYVGANDGMMHVVVAEGANAGQVLFSYIPGQVYPSLAELSDPAYTHKYYVDLTPRVADRVPFGAGLEKSILIGGLGQGGEGYFALDITGLTTFNSTSKLWEPTSVNEAAIASRVLWEFPSSSTSAADLADIGRSFSEVQIVRTNSTIHPMVAIFGNGYNSVSGVSALFIVNPVDGSVIRKFSLGTGPDNGLATPTVTDVDADGKADYVYAGDLHGNLWKVNLTDSNTSNWDIAFADGVASRPLFTAVGPSGPQPITSTPDVMLHPSKNGYLVVFGTGKFLGLSDTLDASQQAFYGIWDYADDDDKSEYLGTFDPLTHQVSNLSTMSALFQHQVILDSYFYDPDGDGDGELLRVTSAVPAADKLLFWLIEPDAQTGEMPNPASTTANYVGWYLPLPQTGERVVTSSMIRDGRAVFISYSPLLSPCSSGGNSILHQLNAADGSRSVTAVLDINRDGAVNSQDYIQITGPSGNPIMVPVSGIQRGGQLQSPAIIQFGRDEISYMSSTSGDIERVRGKGVKTGMTVWQEF